jgi:hypothetical protein
MSRVEAVYGHYRKCEHLTFSYESHLAPISAEIIEQFCSDDSLKCYHYSVEIQKNLSGEGAHPPPQTPLPFGAACLSDRPPPMPCPPTLKLWRRHCMYVGMYVY